MFENKTLVECIVFGVDERDVAIAVERQVRLLSSMRHPCILTEVGVHLIIGRLPCPKMAQGALDGFSLNLALWASPNRVF